MNDKMFSEPKIARWINTVKNNGCAVHRVEPLSLLERHNGEILFALLEADVRDESGHKLPSWVFLRGDACVIVPLVRNTRTGEERFLMVEQRRIGHGGLSLEFPAGMLDRNVDDALGVAQRELEEETGLHVSDDQLKPLWPRPMYSSSGGSDEAIHFFGCIVEIDDKTYHAFDGSVLGEKLENEHLTVRLKTRTEAEREISSLQVLLGFTLFERAFGKEGRM